MVANSLEALEKIEECMKEWTKQIEQVIHGTNVKYDNIYILVDEFNPVGIIDTFL